MTDFWTVFLGCSTANLFWAFLITTVRLGIEAQEKREREKKP